MKSEAVWKWMETLFELWLETGRLYPAEEKDVNKWFAEYIEHGRS